jgi:hypothetical protein
MIVEWYAVKVFSIGTFLGWFVSKRIDKRRKVKCYVITDFTTNKKGVQNEKDCKKASC